MNITSKRELYKESEDRMKEIVKGMNGLSEEEFRMKFLHDAPFHTGFRILVELLMEAKFKE